MKTDDIRGGVITSVQPGSLADRAGLRPGDVLVRINGQVVRDVIDYHFLSAEEVVSFGIRRDGEWLELEGEREYGEPVGLDFAEPLFDAIRLCRNRCPFCFLKGLPKGLRRSLYVRDDDYRLSFLQGTFVTLSNLTDEDWTRIEEQHLSPLYISVHATDPAVRGACLGRRDLPDVRGDLLQLAEMGIQAHTQVVLIPGLNDSATLDITLRDLMDLYPAVQSVSVVPVGLTRFSPPGLRRFRTDEAPRVVKQVEGWQEQAEQRFSMRWVYASDEWYLMQGAEVPATASYDDFPQLENGVGLVRQMLDDWAAVRESLAVVQTDAIRERWGLVCGTLIAPVMGEICRGLGAATGRQVEPLPVENQFFGPSVTVSGLLTGADVSAALEASGVGQALLPRIMFDASGQSTLDGWSPDRLGQAMGGVVHTPSDLWTLVDALLDGDEGVG